MTGIGPGTSDDIAHERPSRGRGCHQVVKGEQGWSEQKANTDKMKNSILTLLGYLRTEKPRAIFKGPRVPLSGQGGTGVERTEGKY